MWTDSLEAGPGRAQAGAAALPEEAGVLDDDEPDPFVVLPDPVVEPLDDDDDEEEEVEESLDVLDSVVDELEDSLLDESLDEDSFDVAGIFDDFSERLSLR